jgi:hypothetical protein
VAGGELERCQRIGRDRVRLDAVEEADHGRGAAVIEQRAHPVTQAGQIATFDRTTDREHNRATPVYGHPD